MKVVFTGVPEVLCNSISKSIAHQLGNSQYHDADGVARFYGHVNQNQHVEIKGSTITVEGERCALWSDHNRGAMHALSISGLKPWAYETSDSRLKWHETLMDYMEGPRASFHEALQYCKEKGLSPTYFYALGGAQADALRLTQYPLRASAEMPTERLQRAREVLALL